MKKLLLADADSIHSEVLATALAGEGYLVFGARNTRAWSQAATRHKFHLILMDESFLGLSRHLFELSWEAFKPFEKIPLIVMTEYPELVERRYKFPQKANFLLKPFHADEMFGLIRQVFFEETMPQGALRA
ncbi:MAG: hypothetical protein HY586_07890 [Candidatus Omnitrophica bacterium]|nr:hypothetical protein [Candidatus Omnitrophota bacterium]